MLCCIECGAENQQGLGWQARIVYDPDDDDEPTEVALYCAVCAREFGPFEVFWFERRAS